MTIDFTDPEVAKAIKDAVAKEVEGLKAKNSELLGKLNEAKGYSEKLGEAEIKLKEIEEERLRASESWTELEARLRNEAAEKEAALKAERENLTSTIVEKEVVSSLAKANVAPHFMDAAMALLKTQVKYADGKVVVGDKALPDYVSEWAASDTGKHFVAAPANKGGGAPGGSGSGTAKTINRSEFEKMATSNPQGVGKFFADGGKVVDD
jgi:uncharacterized membrane-anchored protein YjiN (DUF445 family)